MTIPKLTTARDHPRMGGEKAAGFAHPAGAQRITPAWAGKRNQPIPGSVSAEVHPRMGGEKERWCRTCHPEPGSPPHGRGKGRALLCSSPAPGITPAWAGKRQPLLLHPSLFWDHPRMGGEKLSLLHLRHEKAGSPPHGRGKARGPRFFDVVGGITPAWAGKSLSRPPAGGRVWDHPRMGGEKCPAERAGEICAGSPPHGRGKVISMKRWAPTQRITPAWAGKSGSARSGAHGARFGGST